MKTLPPQAPRGKALPVCVYCGESIRVSDWPKMRTGQSSTAFGIVLHDDETAHADCYYVEVARRASRAVRRG